MREPNFSSPAQNRAAVVVTSTLYDRRALDCTATLPLVNSLTHLAYMTSTSPRIREILATDGGLERLVKILATCQHTDKHSLWKWSLAFQCVVNVGVRGTEAIRTRVVEAGAVHVVLAILENFMKALERAKNEKDKEKQQQQHQQHQEEQHQLAPNANAAAALSIPTVPNFHNSEINKVEGEDDENDDGAADDEDGEGQQSNNDSQDNNNYYGNENSITSGTASPQANNRNNMWENVSAGFEQNHPYQHQQQLPHTFSNVNNSNTLFVIPQKHTFLKRTMKPKMKSYTASLYNIPLLNNLSPDAVLHREEDILLSLQLLAYLSKYPAIREAFHKNHYRNVFSVVEKFTHRIHPTAIIYWAGVIMRNACRKDEARGGVRQCANMQCGKWERFPREFAKCRRCRKAKYCSKSCQSKAWADGHRWWCVERTHSSHPPNPATTSSTTQAAAAAVVAAAPPPPPPAEQVVHLEDNVAASDVLAIPIAEHNNNGNNMNDEVTATTTAAAVARGDATATNTEFSSTATSASATPTNTTSASLYPRRTSLPMPVTRSQAQSNTIADPNTNTNISQPSSAATSSSSSTRDNGDLLFYHHHHHQRRRRNSRTLRSSLASGSSTEVEADVNTDNNSSSERPQDLMDVD